MGAPKYFFSYCFERGAPRVFKIDRISSIADAETGEVLDFIDFESEPEEAKENIVEKQDIKVSLEYRDSKKNPIRSEGVLYSIQEMPKLSIRLRSESDPKSKTRKITVSRITSMREEKSGAFLDVTDIDQFVLQALNAAKAAEENFSAGPMRIQVG